jgi:hypothetical protein
VPNYDGFPEAICPRFHKPDGRLARLLCDSCEMLKSFSDDLEEPMPKIGRAR